MKRGFIGAGKSILLLVAFCHAVPAVAEDATRYASMLVVDNEAWRTDLAIAAGDGEATLRVSDCVGLGALTTVRLPVAGGKLVPRITDYQCSDTRIGVVKLPIVSGTPRLWTEATYRDAIGNRNVVMIPQLPAALPPSRSTIDPAFSFTAEYVFDGIENNSILGKSTFLALTPDGDDRTVVEVTVYAYSDPTKPLATDTFPIDGFTFYELPTPIDFGRIVIKNVTLGAENRTPPGLFAAAFVGYRAGGSPRVELPQTRIAIAQE
jgi:hypothetical protein